MKSYDGELLRKARIAKNLSQENVADHFKISQNYIHMLEANKINPTVGKLVNIARFLDVDPSDLFGAKTYQHFENCKESGYNVTINHNISEEAIRMLEKLFKK